MYKEEAAESDAIMFKQKLQGGSNVLTISSSVTFNISTLMGISNVNGIQVDISVV